MSSAVPSCSQVKQQFLMAPAQPRRRSSLLLRSCGRGTKGELLKGWSSRSSSGVWQGAAVARSSACKQLFRPQRCAHLGGQRLQQAAARLQQQAPSRGEARDVGQHRGHMLIRICRQGRGPTGRASRERLVHFTQPWLRGRRPGPVQGSRARQAGRRAGGQAVWPPCSHRAPAHLALQGPRGPERV